MTESFPADLGAAIAQQSTWLQLWVQILVATNLAAILFVITRKTGKFGFRKEAAAIVFSFLAAGISMSWMYSLLGYVRLLGLPHLIFWLPVYTWLLIKFRRDEFQFPFKHYLLIYFVIAGISIAIDIVDVARYALGER